MRYRGSEKYEAQALEAARAILGDPENYPPVLRAWATKFLKEHGGLAAGEQRQGEFDLEAR